MPGIEVNPDNVPQELRERDQWLLWSHDTNPAKRPLNEDGFGASWNDPSEWLSFQRAIELAEKPRFDGVGFVISTGDPYIGLDLDGCLREPFEEKPKNWLPDISVFDGTYIEYSQSGTGLHPFVRDTALPEWWNDSHFTEEEHEGVEAYEEKFFIVTGRPVETLSETPIASVEISGFLSEAYETINGEPPRLPGGNGDNDHEDVNVSVYDILTRSSYPANTNTSHPYHDSSTGTNFRVDAGGETFRCWRHSVTGNALHLLGVKHGVIECGEWAKRDLTTDEWREIFDIARDEGLDVPDKKGRTPAADGGAAAATAPDGQSLGPSGSINPANVMAAAGYNPDDGDDFSDLKNSEIAFAIDRILEHNDDWNFLVIDDDTEEVWSYSDEDGIWRNDGERRLKQVCRLALGPENSKRRHSEVVYQIQGNPNVQLPRDDLGAPDATIATPNGLLDLFDHDTEPLRPEHYAINKIPTKYNPSADYQGTRWLQFLQNSVTPSDLDKLQEYAGYCLWHHAQPYGKALFLVGPTDSGKGTFLKAITQVIGKENIANESLYDLLQTRWGAASLFGKMANIRNEVTPGGLKNIQKFKELTGGGDTLSAEYKGQDKFEFAATQKFLFSTNQMPDIEEADGAFYNRLLFAKFPETVPKEDQDETLLDKLDDESNAILNWMLDGLQRLLRQSGFSNERTREEKEQIMQEHGDAVDRFISHVLVITGDADDAVHKSDLYELFTRFNDYLDRDPVVQQTFTKGLKELDGVTDGRSRKVPGDTDKPHVYKGIRVDESALKELQAEAPRHHYADGDDGSDDGFQAYFE